MNLNAKKNDEQQYLKDSDYIMIANGCYSGENTLCNRESMGYLGNVKLVKCVSSNKNSVITTFNSFGDVTSEFSFENDTSKCLMKRYIKDSSTNNTTMKEYDSDNKDTTFIVWNEDNLILLKIKGSDTLYKYNYLSDNKISSFHNRVIDRVDSFLYKHDGECIANIYKKSSNGERLILTAQEIYDKHGFVFERSYVGSESMIQSYCKPRNVYTYYSDGHVKSRKNNELYCKYDKFGNIVKRVWYDDGIIIKKETNIYNKYNRLILHITKDYKNKDVEKMIVQYQNNIKTKVLCYRNGDIVRTLFFDKYGNPEEERLKDNIIKRWYYEYCSLP